MFDRVLNTSLHPQTFHSHVGFSEYYYLYLSQLNVLLQYFELHDAVDTEMQINRENFSNTEFSKALQ